MVSAARGETATIADATVPDARKLAAGVDAEMKAPRRCPIGIAIKGADTSATRARARPDRVAAAAPVCA